MLTDWIYTTPIWFSSIAILVIALGLALGVLLLVHRVIDVEFRRQHNDLIGFVIAVVGVVYAVLLAFISVVTWESYTRGDEIVADEANYVGNLYRDTSGCRTRLRGRCAPI